MHKQHIAMHMYTCIHTQCTDSIQPCTCTRAHTQCTDSIQTYTCVHTHYIHTHSTWTAYSHAHVYTHTYHIHTLSTQTAYSHALVHRHTHTACTDIQPRTCAHKHRVHRYHTAVGMCSHTYAHSEHTKSKHIQRTREREQAQTQRESKHTVHTGVVHEHIQWAPWEGYF